MILLQWAVSVMKFLPVESGPLLILRGCVRLRLTGQDSLGFRDINYTHYKIQIIRLLSLILPQYQNNMGLLEGRKMKVMMMMMREKRKTTCDEGRGKEVGDTEEDEVVVGAETIDEEAGDERLES